jgi:hypothetical protein
MLMVACTAKQAEHQEYEQSALLHNAMLNQASKMEDTLALMLADSAWINQQDSLNAILAALENWEKQLVEVPGNEDHDHNHGAHEHHDHEQASVEVTPEQMLLIQRELENRLNNISKRLQQISLIKKQ